MQGRRSKIITNSFEKKNAKILKYGNSHEKADLIIKVGYEHNIMKLLSYCEETMSLTDKALWLKSYNEEVLEEMRQLRGRVSSLIKLSVTQGMYTHGKMLVRLQLTHYMFFFSIIKKSSNNWCRIRIKNQFWERNH